MLFNSYEFIFLFLPATVFVYFYLAKKRLTIASKAWLILASLFFYSWWNVVYLPLILGSILFNFAVGSALSNEKISPKSFPRKIILIFGLVANISLLGYFKYVDFFISTANSLFGFQADLLHIMLPLGISFFTFTQIAYLVDAYRQEVKEMDYLNYSLFVTFFPHLLAGPILHHKEMMPQFDDVKTKVVNYKNISAGLFLFAIGLFKKVEIADNFAVWANAGFNSHNTMTFLEAWATSLSYTFQLYFDFSGYTDMALGAALFFNIKLPQNFNSPYKALDIQDFWRRWHMTLSRFLRDYIYIPLGGNRVAELTVCANLMVTFLIGGLWHGAAWTFVFWGMLHGLALVVHRIWKNNGFRMHKVIAWLITFNFLNITWIFFRATSFEDAFGIIKGMLGFNGIAISAKFIEKYPQLAEFGISSLKFIGNQEIKEQTLYWLVAAIPFVLLLKNSNIMASNFRPTKKTLAFAVIVFCFGVMNMSKATEFLYFQF